MNAKVSQIGIPYAGGYLIRCTCCATTSVIARADVRVRLPYVCTTCSCDAQDSSLAEVYEGHEVRARSRRRLDDVARELAPECWAGEATGMIDSIEDVEVCHG